MQTLSYNKTMKFQIKNLKFANVSAAVLSVGAALFSIGCEAPTTNTTANGNAAVNTNTAVANTNTAPMNAPVENKEMASRMPVTLPVLDAMFGDESFAGELKTKVQLTDEQLQNLKKLSRESVAELNEDEADENPRSTRAATERAGQKIREMLGEQKATQLFEFVRERWSSGEELVGNRMRDDAVIAGNGAGDSRRLQC